MDKDEYLHLIDDINKDLTERNIPQLFCFSCVNIADEWPEPEIVSEDLIMNNDNAAEDCIHVYRLYLMDEYLLSLPAKVKFVCIHCGGVDYRLLEALSVDE